jgi:para-aminobenzoate synthetase component 1
VRKTPVLFLNGNDGNGLLAFGEGPSIRSNSSDSISQLSDFKRTNKDSYIFGYLSYDLKNEVEILTSLNRDNKNTPDLYFWRPQFVIEISNDNFNWVQGERNSVSQEYLNKFFKRNQTNVNSQQELKFNAITSKSGYLSNIEAILDHIQQGDLYEMNYCQEFISENIELNNALDLYWNLNDKTKAPFSCFFQFDEFSILSASPERYIQKRGSQLLSQPIKGTARRGDSLDEDKEMIKSLKADPKEQSENIMIVDLVRNDLSRLAKPKTVKVDELCGVYTFETVHQMISTISCELRDEIKLEDILRATFPMGSMTGAPKVKAMELIEKYEDFKRGIYSGGIGYLAPNGDFDFNVVIRSLVHNSISKTMTCAVGGAITAKSIPESEYEECYTKVNRLIHGLSYE